VDSLEATLAACREVEIREIDLYYNKESIVTGIRSPACYLFASAPYDKPNEALVEALYNAGSNPVVYLTVSSLSREKRGEAMMSSYPPGVTGSEYAIAGPDYEQEVDEKCPACGGSMVERDYRKSRWVSCCECDYQADCITE